MKVLSMLILFTSLFSTGNSMSPKMRKAYEIINQVVDSQIKQHGLQAIGTGLSAPDQIKSLHAHFISNQRLGVDEVRLLVVSGVEEFLKLTNEDLSIRPFLENYPFNSRNIEYMISFQQKNGCYVERKYVAFVSLVNGEIHYRSYDKATDEYCDRYKETFEEAKQILAKQKLGKSQE